MRLSMRTIAASIGVVLCVWPRPAATQGTPDFVFTDAEGHLVLRFVNAKSTGGLDADHFEEVANLELSTMVHDRLRADAIFEAEPVDASWATSMETRLARHVRETGREFSAVDVECRSASCRVVLEHTPRRPVEAHRALMGAAQRAIQMFIDANLASFEPTFMIAAQYQEPGQPYMKLFLRRAGGPAVGLKHKTRPTSGS